MIGHQEKRYCICGASMDVRSVPPKFAKGIAVIFEDYHSGEGHGPATPSQASRARQRELRRERHQEVLA